MKRFLITSVSAFALMVPAMAVADMDSGKGAEAPQAQPSENYTLDELGSDIGEGVEATGNAIEEGAEETAEAVDNALTGETELRTVADLQAEGGLSSSNVIGKSVIGSAGEEIATVHDIVVPAEGKAQAILSDGGILGVAPRLTAVSYSSLTPSFEDRSLDHFTLAATAQELKEKQAFVYAQDNAEAANAELMAASSTSLLELTGQEVSNNAGEEIAEIKDIYIDDTGAPRHVLLGTGGFLDMGEKIVAVDYDDMTVEQGAGGPTVNLTRAQLEAAASLELDAQR